MTASDDPDEESFLSGWVSMPSSRPPVTDALQLVVGLATEAVDNVVGASVSVRQVANTRLTRALTSRAVIGQAQGILMAREHTGPEEAFDVLRRASQLTNRKVRDVAEELVAQASTRPPDEGARDAHS